jgi:polyhydroxybutyrate depolymerase
MLARWLPILALLLSAFSAMAATTRQELVRAAGLARTYQLHIPDLPRKNTKAPLVLVFHGSGADGASMEKLSRFSELADREGFIVAYPDAVEHEWNDGREAAKIPSQAMHVDDVAFVDAIIKQVSAAHPIDPKRIYAAGFSNGGIFAHLLGSKLAYRLAAIAPVSGGLAEPVLRDFKPTAPLSVCIIHGAADKVVPYYGGQVDDHDFGRVIGTKQTANVWTQQPNITFAAPTTKVLSDTTSNDHFHVKYTRWPSEGGKGTEVVLYTIEDGGHGWPTDPQGAPSILKFWRISHSFDTTTAIWNFFKSHPKA